MESILLFLKALLLSLSFFGLCAVSRTALKLNRFIAPCFTACSIICLLMFGGMLHILKYAFFLLYFGGFVGLVYSYLIRRSKPDWLLIGLYCILAVYSAWRFKGSLLFLPDDLSHWGTAARYLLQFDSFPDGSTAYVTFQSYPLGATAFVYYICRMTNGSEPVMLIAQGLLQAILFLPLLSHIRGNHKLAAPLLTAFFLLFYKFNRPLTSLTVDWLLAFYGFGIAAAILYYRNEPRKALLPGIAGIVSVLYIKSSGMFFAALYILLLVYITNRSKGKSAAFRILALAGIAAIAASLAWNLHVKSSFPAGFDSKHAVSLSAYVEKLRSKGIMRSLSIAWKMVKKWLQPEYYQVFSVLFMILSFGSVYVTTRRYPETMQYRKPVFRALYNCIACYAVWFAMLYAMYIFSMPYNEAARLASFSRYDSTGLLCMVGLACIPLLYFYSGIAFHSKRRIAWISAGLIAVLLCSAPMLSLGVEYPFFYNTFYSDLVSKQLESNSYRGEFIRVKNTCDLPDGEYFVYFGEDTPPDHRAPKYYAAKYELSSPEIKVALHSDAGSPWILCTPDGTHFFTTAEELLADQLDGCAAVLLMTENSELENVLNALLTAEVIDLPIIYAYEAKGVV